MTHLRTNKKELDILTVSALQVNFLMFVFLFETGSLFVTQAGVQWCDLAYCSLLPDSSHPPASASKVASTTGMHHHTQLIFVFLVETVFNLNLGLLPFDVDWLFYPFVGVNSSLCWCSLLFGVFLERLILVVSFCV